MAMAIAASDGHISSEETALMAIELMRFGVDEEKTKIISSKAANLDFAEACVIISKMTNEEKKYVTAYLGTIICADGKIEDSEIKTWALVTTICDLPKMSLREAIELMGKL